MTRDTKQTLARYESNVQWWQKQTEQVERDRKNMKYIWFVGLPLSLVLAVRYWDIALCCLLTTAFIWGMGIYMTAVRRVEFRASFKEAKVDLEQAKLDLKGAQDKPSL